jgi:molecular chaperone Hsp33
MNGDRVVHASIPGEEVRLLGAVTTDTVEAICSRHGTTSTVAAALGRAVTGAALLAMMQKDLERVTLQVSCDGPIGGIVAQASANGNVRGYVRNPRADAEARQGKYDVPAIVGDGVLSVVREMGTEIGLGRHPYVGSVELVSGEIGQDLNYYLNRSEQIPTGTSFGVYVHEPSARVLAAGGVMVQLMPGASEQLAGHLERSFAQAPAVSGLLREGVDPVSMLECFVEPFRVEVLGTRTIRFACECSKERALRIVAALGLETLEEMIADGRGERLVCEFCSAGYDISVEELEALLRHPPA